MPQSRTVQGAAAGTALGALAPDIYQVSLAIVRMEWTPESQTSAARILGAILTGILGILALARDKITEAIEDAELPELDAGLIERIAASKVGRRLGLRVERRRMPKVTPDDEPLRPEAHPIVPPLKRQRIQPTEPWPPPPPPPEDEGESE